MSLLTPGTIHEMVDAGKITADEGKLRLKKASISQHLEGLSKKYVESTRSFFKPLELQEDFEVICNDTGDSNSSFFQPMTETELHDNFDIPEFCLIPNIESFFDYCQFIYKGLKNTLKGSWHKRRDDDMLIYPGLRMELKYNGKAQIIREYENSRDPVNRYEWDAEWIFGYLSNVPHCLAISMHITQDPSLEYILRSELIIIIRLILWKGRTEEYLHHQIVPVLLISARPDHFRVIEAHYDGKKIQIRYGSPILITEETSLAEQQKNMETVLRWFVSMPKGDTRSFKTLKSTSQQKPRVRNDNTQIPTHQKTPKPDPKSMGKEGGFRKELTLR